jgi:ornithine cyclodeaminase/alanine dehydrogenase-like protein (mu-crystallin family)
MIVVTEDEARQVVCLADAIEAVEAVFRAMAVGAARNFPVVRERLPEAGGTFGVKSGVDLSGGVVGLKAGGYWAGNEGRGLKNHQSTTLLCEAETGRAFAVVVANYLTAIRTAAASAVASRALARKDAQTLAVFGTGAQALPQIEAQAAVRPFRRLLVCGRNRARAEEVAALATSFVRDVEVVLPEVAAREADVLVTVTPATDPIVADEWIRPGTHINAVGSDTKGKGELAPRLVARARIVVDEWEQARRIGECQHAFSAGLIDHSVIAGPIGAVLNGAVAGRTAAEDITLFDSTGVALQDIAVAKLAVDRLTSRAPGTRETAA